MEFSHQIGIQAGRGGFPGALLQAVALLVHQVLEPSTSSSHVQQPSDHKGWLVGICSAWFDLGDVEHRVYSHKVSLTAAGLTTLQIREGANELGSQFTGGVLEGNGLS